MTNPVENCPKPETEIRERAWTAEQAIANLLDRALDAAAFLNAIKRNDRAEPLREAVHAVWPESTKSMDARFHLSSAYAATLRQQGVQASGVVTDEMVEIAAQAISMRSLSNTGHPYPIVICRLDARAAIEAVAPLLRAPAEQCGRVDEGMSIDLALGYAKAACIGPMSSQAIAVIESALAQNAQGEAWGYIGPREQGTMQDMGYAQVLDKPLPQMNITTPVYIHAERARVPDLIWREASPEDGDSPDDWLADGDYADGQLVNVLCAQRLPNRQLRVRVESDGEYSWELLPIAAPSQPEDAA